MSRDAQIWALFALAALATGSAFTAITIALAFLTDFTVVVVRGRGVTIYIHVRRWLRDCGDCSRPVVGFHEAKRGLLGVFARSIVAAFAILAGTTSIAPATSIATFTTFTPALLLALVADVVVGIAFCGRVGTAF